MSSNLPTTMSSERSDLSTYIKDTAGSATMAGINATLIAPIPHTASSVYLIDKNYFTSPLSPICGGGGQRTYHATHTSLPIKRSYDARVH